jgi:cytochrome c oxidase subunit 2
LAAFAAIVSFATNAFATGQPTPWQIGFQDPASPVMSEIVGFHNLLLWIIAFIALFVLGLMIYVMVRFRASRNPTPSRTAHNTLLEVTWTVVPILILVFIAIPSFKLLYFENRTPEADMTLKAIGHQFFWEYRYPDHGDLSFFAAIDCTTAEDCEALAEDGKQAIRLLSTDNPVVVPVGATVRLLTTSDDVIHGWAVPAFGVKLDATPGRLNEAWFRAEQAGVYYGQCSELCGTQHGYMPIMVKAVPQAEFDAWIEQAKVEFAHDEGADASVQVAHREQR